MVLDMYNPPTKDIRAVSEFVRRGAAVESIAIHGTVRIQGFNNSDLHAYVMKSTLDLVNVLCDDVALSRCPAAVYLDLRIDAIPHTIGSVNLRDEGAKAVAQALSGGLLVPRLNLRIPIRGPSRTP